MKFHKLIINNFLGIGHIEVEFNYNGLVLINGVNKDSPISTSNGASKSSIPEAILWCLYGTTKRGLKGDDVVNRAAGSNCSVDLYFDDYRVVRGRSHSDLGNGLRVFHGGVEITKGTAAQTQEIVEEIVGRGKLAFEKVFHFGQGDTEPLASMSDATLKLIFEQSFNLGFIHDCFLKIKDVGKEWEDDLTEKQAKIKTIEFLITSTDTVLVNLKEQNDLFAEQCAKDIGDLELKIKGLQNAYKRMLVDEKTYEDAWGDEFKKQFESDKAILDKLIAKAKANIDLINRDVAKADHDYKVSIIEGKAFRDSLVKTHNEMKAVESKVGTPCPACTKTIEKGDIQAVTAKLSSKIDEEMLKLDNYKMSMSKAEKALEEAKVKHAAAEKAYTEIWEKRGAFDGFQKAQTEYLMTRRQILDLEAQIKTYEKMIEDVKVRENPAPAKIVSTHRDLEKATQDKNVLEEDAAKKAADVLLVKELLGIFGNAGLKSYIFDSVTPRLNELINGYLSKLDNIQIEFSTQKQLKSGELREKFDIVVNTEHGPSSFEALSGGEKQRVALAISLAMNKLMREVSGDPLNILFLDEVAESLDETSSEAVFEVIRDFAGDVDNVFVISHNQNLKDIIPVGITVIKHGGFATLG